MPDLALTPEVAWALATGGPWPDPGQLRGDPHFMALALQEALKGVGLASPNPPVGCVLVKGGQVIGRGVHTRAGDPHGEIMALRDAEAHGQDPTGATAFVTLEPCCHQGRTGPCTQALIQAGIARVVVPILDRLRLPIAFVGVGEGVDDLIPFDAEAFVDGLLDA